MYPEALMLLPMKVWELPNGKEDTFIDYCNSGNYFAEEKKDGFWYEFEKTDNHKYLFSRTISAKDGLLVEKGANVPHIMSALDCLPPKTIVIGEVYYPGKTSKDTTTIMGCLPDKAIARQKDNLIHYYVHDIIYYDGVDLKNVGARKRYEILSKIWELHNLNQYKEFLELANIVEENLFEYTENVLSDPLKEGVVLKHKDEVYQVGKKPAKVTIKRKKSGETDVVCIGFCDATKYYDGKLDLIANYGGKDYLQWPYWVVEEMDLSTGLIISEQKVKVGEMMTIRGINFRTVPVTKGYYYGWKTSIAIGAYNDEGNIQNIGNISSGLTDQLKEDMSNNPDKYLGKALRIGFMELDKEAKTVRHGNLIEVRIDKNGDECKISEIFI